MEEWGAIGLLILFFAPALGRLQWVLGLLTLAAGVIVMLLSGADSVGALGIAGLVCVGSGFCYHKITGGIVITDILSFITGIVLIIVAIATA